MRPLKMQDSGLSLCRLLADFLQIGVLLVDEAGICRFANDQACELLDVDRDPATRKTVWKIGEDPKLIGWFEFKNPSAAIDVDLVWKKNGEEKWRFSTNVGVGKNWRTWAEKRITKKDAGNWSVDVVDANGHVYETITYTVE